MAPRWQLATLTVVLCSLSLATASRHLNQNLPLRGAATAAPVKPSAVGPTTLRTRASPAYNKFVGGTAAVATLTDSISVARRIAAKHQTNVKQLKKALEHDKDLKVDFDHEALLYVDGGLVVPPVPPPGEKVAIATLEINGTSAKVDDADDPSTADAFKLHSRYGSSRIIYLDFDGHVANMVAWGERIVTPPYSIDNDPAFSEAELKNIVAIWRSVAEDYAPFDVDVTTEYPGNERFIGNNAGTGPGIRCAIGGSSMDWYGAGAGGIAYVGSFGNSFYSPAYVFPTQLGNGGAKYVAEAISHEVGHTLGLSHDGTSTAAYFAGQGNWAPIMGVSYYRPLSQWNKGDYPDANQKQDDIAIIKAKLKTTLPADAGSSFSSAWPLRIVLESTNTSETAMTRGIVDDPSSEDFFYVDASSGALTATVSIVPEREFVRSNLDAQLTLYSSDGQELVAANPPTNDQVTPENLGAKLTFNIPAAGRYYLGVKPAADGLINETGYSSYGSLGAYLLNATYVPAAPGSFTRSEPPPPKPEKAIASITTMLKSFTGTKRIAAVRLKVLDNLGGVVPGAVVRGQWVFSPKSVLGFPKQVTLTTSNAGLATNRSPSASRGGIFTFQVLNVTVPSGLKWDKADVQRSISVLTGEKVKGTTSG